MNLARFAFRLVDTDHSGSLSTDEVQNVVEIIYGDTVADYKNNVYRKRELAHETAVRVSVGDGAWCQIHSFIHSFISIHLFIPLPLPQSTPRIYDHLDRNRDGLLSVKEWVDVAIEFPQLIEPAFQVQRRLKQKIINNHFWNVNGERIRQNCEEMEIKKNHGWWDYHSKFGFKAEQDNLKEAQERHLNHQKSKQTPPSSSAAVVPEDTTPAPKGGDEHIKTETAPVVKIGKNGRQYIVGSDLRNAQHK